MITIGRFGKVCVDVKAWESSSVETGGTDDGIAVSFGEPQHATVWLSEEFIERAYELIRLNKQPVVLVTDDGLYRDRPHPSPYLRRVSQCCDAERGHTQECFDVIAGRVTETSHRACDGRGCKTCKGTGHEPEVKKIGVVKHRLGYAVTLPKIWAGEVLVTNDEARDLCEALNGALNR
jgi:hypothetical protein